MVCPKCGGDTGVMVSVRMNGWASCIVEWNGDVDSTEMDGVVRTYPKTGLCLDCNKRVPAPNVGPLGGHHGRV